MSDRTSLISQLTVNLASHTGFNVSNNLPYNNNGEPLYNTNKKTVYVGEADQTVIELVPTLRPGLVQATAYSIPAYVTVDAKTLPSDMNTVVANCLSAISVIANTYVKEASVTTEITDDYITYSFEYNFSKI